MLKEILIGFTGLILALFNEELTNMATEFVLKYI